MEVAGPCDFPPNQLSHCIDDLVAWCLPNGMQINPDKTELMLISTPTLSKHFDKSLSLDVAGCNVVLQASVKVIGVHLNSKLTFDKHVSSIVQSCNFPMHALRHIRPLLSRKMSNELACSIVASRLNYCNFLLYNTSSHNLDKLQKLQNNLARIVCQVPAQSAAGPLLHSLHWLSVRQ